MSKSIRNRRLRKSADFPLSKHPRGYWCKRYKVTGTSAWKMAYFGRIADDPDGQAAVEKWLAQKDYLLNGLTPPEDPSGLTVKELANGFLTAKVRLIRTGELSDRTFHQYHGTCARLVEAMGGHRLVDALTPTDFGVLREKLAAGRGPVALGNEITVVRMVFKFAFDEGLIDRPMRYGQSFDKPSRKTLRVERAKRGPKMFEASELHAILDAAGVPMQAFVLLGINAAFGATDIAGLPQSAIDLRSGWIDYARGKTGIGRRIPLWPETVAAVKEAIDQRPRAADKADDGLAFLTRFGSRWLKLNRQEGSDGPATDDKEFKGATPDDAIGKEFKKLLVKVGIKRTGLGFYGLRHTFRTVADEAKDQPAAGHIMGHHDPSMAATYRERISDDRLQAVVNVVRNWLFPAARKPTKTRKARKIKSAVGVQEVADDDGLQQAIASARQAIQEAAGPTRRTLESVWLADIDNATRGDGEARRRLLETWGNDRDELPKLRVVNAG